MVSTFSPSQQEAYDAAIRGTSVLITGSAGTGKSYLLKHIYNALTMLGKKVCITALTGCAAYLLSEDMGIKVNTIHSWVGFGYGEDEAKKYIGTILKNHPLRQRWRATNVLIIDEISMMSAQMFDKIEEIARGVRGVEHMKNPFGGLQVICVGDFFQLPPVVKTYAQAAQGQALFAFQASSWASVVQRTIMLRTIYRQRDETFQKILEEARHGDLSDTSIAVLQERMQVSWKKREIKPTLIFTKRAVVDDINKRNIDVLKGTKYTYNVKTHIAPTNTIRGVHVLKETEPIVKDAIAKLDAEASYVQSLTLCVKAQVMLIKNLDIGKGLVNGSRGVVVDFDCVEVAHITRILSKEPVQPPVEDNPQPLTPIVDTKDVPYDFGYTRTIITRFQNGNELWTKEDVLTFQYYPRVKFESQESPIVVEFESWNSTLEKSVSRHQIPLALAWAVTTHKIQGATLDCALIDIGSDVFEYGQAYVALSRVKSLDSLYVHNLEPSCVRAHPIVKDYYSALKGNHNHKIQPAENPEEIAPENTIDDEHVVTAAIPDKKYFSIFNPAKGQKSRHE